MGAKRPNSLVFLYSTRRHKSIIGLDRKYKREEKNMNNNHYNKLFADMTKRFRFITEDDEEL